MEELGHLGLETGQRRVRGDATIDAQPLLVRRREDDHPRLAREEEPHDLDTVIEVPSCLLAKLDLILELPLDLDRQDGRDATELPPVLADVGPTPHGGM